MNSFTEEEILYQLDLAFFETPSEYYPEVREQDIKYNFFLDLEHGYYYTAGRRIHVYGDSTRWAIVFEKSSYGNRINRAEIELIYVGNCVSYYVEKYSERNYISNLLSIILIDENEFLRIENNITGDEELETFELIHPDIKEIHVREHPVPFDNNYKNYEKLGIEVRDYNNPQKRIDFKDMLRYLHQTNPGIISASEKDIKHHIPQDIPKLMVLNDFHFSSIYEKENPPSHQELYALIAKVLVTGDVSFWKPTQEPNNSWKNWESGHL